MGKTLIYTSSFIMQQAVKTLNASLPPPYCYSDIEFFNWRLQFLVCATILDRYSIFIDAAQSDIDDVEWLLDKFRSRGIERKIFVITKKDNIENERIKKFKVSLIYDVATLTNALTLISQCPSPLFDDGSIVKSIRSSLKRKISYSDYSMITDWDSSRFWARNMDVSDKQLANRRYALRKKLNLDTLSEYNCLANILNSN